ncbi:DUF1552 domain-containing protein [Colwellia sp. 6_MG-2023]|uniref:DUF1552 domain-containing protein n=1 Tax=Colwellia sp. 6_MG-2023 TaxID=3062676 RepID=UPI0026E41262|nr:DUF1552 domain-containing protein [Colwellia sp. 6_MG-2023]MDO6487543.1 DUF1552 domain-containing protein [Colwellia sp. 6_MG-2023]
MKTKPVKLFLFITGLLSVILAASVLAVATIYSPLNGVSGDGVLRFFGRFHPLVLHFPITLLVLALSLELLMFSSKSWSRWSALGLPILIHMALVTDSTRVVTYQTSIDGGSGRGNQLPYAAGLSLQHHQQSHSAARDEVGWERRAKFDQYMAERLSEFLTKNGRNT